MKFESENFNHEEEPFTEDNTYHDESLKNIKDKIEIALKNVDTIKDLKPTISWSSKDIFKEQNKMTVENNDEIVLCVAIKMKKNDENITYGVLENGFNTNNNGNFHHDNEADENKSLSPELKFHSTNIFTKKREMLDIQNKSKTMDIDDDSPASYTLRSNDDDYEDDNSILSDTSLTDTKHQDENYISETFKKTNQFNENESANFSEGRKKQTTQRGHYENDDFKKKSTILDMKTNILAPTPLSAPNSPMKKAGRKSKLQRSQSSEQTQCIGLNTRESSAYSRIRRLRSRHSQSLERVWLPGRSESFNARVSSRFQRKESNSQFYFLSPCKQESCHTPKP